MNLVLQHLAGPGKPLSVEPPDAREIEGLRRSGMARLHDARNPALSLESRFDLAYNAGHTLCIAATGFSAVTALHRFPGAATHARVGSGGVACVGQMPPPAQHRRVRG